MEGRSEDDFEPDMPPIEGSEYLAHYLFGPGELGVMMSGGLGPSAITHEELAHWAHNTSRRLASWERRFLIQASREYVNELSKAAKRDAKPAWQSPDATPMVTDTQRSLRALALANA